MNGDFLLRRGQNDFAVEADIIAFEPALCNDNNANECEIIHAWSIQRFDIMGFFILFNEPAL